MGDSHAAYLGVALKSAVLDRRDNFFEYAANYCVPFIADDARQRCNDINAHVLQAVAREKPDIVFMFAHYLSYQEAFQSLGKIPFNQAVLERAEAFRQAGARQIIIIGQMPTWQDGLPNVLLRHFLVAQRPIPQRTYEGVVAASLRQDRLMRDQIYPDGISYVSLKDFLCTASGCLTEVGPDIKSDLVVQDYGHLTKAGAAWISNGLISRFLPR